jgi:SAM-dependent methyltransferase
MIDNYLPNCVEDYTFSSILGDVSGKSVLDVGCGTGASTRLIKQLGAARVVGMDISSEMLKLAQVEEQRRPLGIEYVLGDMFAPAILGCFDLVSAFGSLTSSPTRDHLLKTAEMIFNNLIAGGRLVASFYEPQPLPVSQRLEKYGLTFSMPEPLQEGDAFHMVIRTNGEPLTFQDYYYRRTTYEWAFRTAGFQTIRWHRPLVSPQGLQQFGQEFWQDYVENQVSIYLECVKG